MPIPTNSATRLGARSGAWLLRHETLLVGRDEHSHPGGSGRQEAPGWSASRGQERVVRRRPISKRQTFRSEWKGLAGDWQRRDMTKTRLAYSV